MLQTRPPPRSATTRDPSDSSHTTFNLPRPIANQNRAYGTAIVLMIQKDTLHAWSIRGWSYRGLPSILNGPDIAPRIVGMPHSCIVQGN